MTAKERMARAMALGVADRVPVMCQMSIGHMLLQTGLPPSRFWFSSDCFAEGLLNLRELYSFDGILISLYGHSPDWEGRITRIQAGAGGETIFWKNRDLTFFPSDDLSRHFPAKTPRQVSLSEFDPESLPDFKDHIPVSQGLTFALDREHLFDVFDFIHARCGADYSIHGDVDLGDAKKRVGGRVFIKGNLDPVNVLLRGTPEAVEGEARRLVSIGKPGGGIHFEPGLLDRASYSA